MKQLNILVLLFTFLAGNVLAQESATDKDTRFDSLITAGIHEIYRLEFENAENTFATVRNEYPGHPAGLFFDAMIVWWEIMLDFDNEEYDDIFKEKLENVIDMCDDILDKNENNVDAIFFKGGALGFRGKLHSIRKSWFNAAMDGKDALPLVHKAYALAPENKDVQLGFGIYNYYAEVIPDEYPVVKPFMLFFPEGNRKKGLEQLETAAAEGRYSKYEARYFLMTSYYKYEKDYTKALEFAEKLTTQFPDNPTFQRYYGRIYVRKGDYNNAVKIFRSIYDKANEDKRGYSSWVKREAAYYIGVYYKNRNKADSALVYFRETEDLSKALQKEDDDTSGFLVNAVLYQGMLYERKNENDIAAALYRRVLDYDEYKDSHDRAERYLERLDKK